MQALIIKYKAIAKRIETGQGLVTNSSSKAHTPAYESAKKIDYDKRRLSNISSKGHSASKSPSGTKLRAISREWNYSTLLNSKNETLDLSTTNSKNSRTLL